MPVPLVAGTHATLIEDERLRRHGSDADEPEPAGWYFDQLCVAQVNQGRVVSHLWKVTAPGHVLRALLLFNRQAGETDNMVARKRQVDGFTQRYAPGRRRLG